MAPVERLEENNFDCVIKCYKTLFGLWFGEPHPCYSPVTCVFPPPGPLDGEDGTNRMSSAGLSRVKQRYNGHLLPKKPQRKRLRARSEWPYVKRCRGPIGYRKFWVRRWPPHTPNFDPVGWKTFHPCGWGHFSVKFSCGLDTVELHLRGFGASYGRKRPVPGKPNEMFNLRSPV
ncbi:Tektin-1 [Anopheles sinensis]|uniref:Tektin-1 n=1 Tax=Anopheles sinensis TaxID=74873 RepID=A0A084VTY5_ANOSI|nr:Tektin-1 [Anopheles sinensis]